jgi:hypothetical protein
VTLISEEVPNQNPNRQAGEGGGRAAERGAPHATDGAP